MVLDIDSELIKSPELWVIHGKKYIPLPESADAINTLISRVASGAKETEKAANEALVAIRNQEQSSGPRPVATGPEKKYTLTELKELALLTRYFNMFDFVYSTTGRKWLRWMSCQQAEEWKAWTNYMRDFFDENASAKAAWDDLSKLGIYAESFRKFVNNDVLGKKPERPKT